MQKRGFTGQGSGAVQAVSGQLSLPSLPLISLVSQSDITCILSGFQGELDSKDYVYDNSSRLPIHTIS